MFLQFSLRGHAVFYLRAGCRDVSARRCPLVSPLVWVTCRCVLGCILLRSLVRLCPLVSLLSAGTRRCARERSRGGVRYGCAGSFFCNSLFYGRAHAVVHGSVRVEVSGKAVPAHSSAILPSTVGHTQLYTGTFCCWGVRYGRARLFLFDLRVHTPLCTRVFKAGVLGTAVPGRFSANLVRTPLCTRVLGAEVPGTAVPARFSAILLLKLGPTPLCTGVFITEVSVKSVLYKYVFYVRVLVVVYRSVCC